MMCNVPGGKTHLARSGKHETCLTHSTCYVARYYMPFHEPCLACMSWYRAIANEMLDKEIRLYNIQELKAWFKKLLRVNKPQRECRGM